MRIGIIGSAGRKPDTDKVSLRLYKEMIHNASTIIGVQPAYVFDHKITLVSGGAAFSDHVAVSLFLLSKDNEFNLELHMPTQWNNDKSEFFNDQTGKVANYWHKEFSKRIGGDEHQSLDTIGKLISSPPKNFDVKFYAGFKLRNLQVAKVDMLIAFTFNKGDKPKPKSGTIHTWNRSQAVQKVHVDLGEL